MTSALQKKETMSEEMVSAKQSIEGDVKQLQDRLMEAEEMKKSAQDKMTNMQQELFAAKDELKKKINQLTQVNNMKKMIQDKNGKIKELRERLGKYEDVELQDE